MRPVFDEKRSARLSLSMSPRMLAPGALLQSNVLYERSQIVNIAWARRRPAPDSRRLTGGPSGPVRVLGRFQLNA